ncbi:MAG TPA: tetratricopeptide repeat protein, partial [Candidatus Wallbacteria bacterium]|nr:tetratricopeptide repeat protein [Candidatus Wallbacteria bacterium]
MTNKIKLNFYSIALILTALIFAYGEASPQSKEEAAGDAKTEIINSLMQSQNYQKALDECSKAGTETGDKAVLKAVYNNYALLLDKNLKIDLNHITSFYLNFDKTEAASNLQPYFLLISYLDTKQKHKEAAKLLDKVNVIFPSNSFYVSSAPVIFSKAGRIAEAYKIIKEELDKKPDAETEKRIKTQLIEVHINAKKTDEALKLLEEEMKKYPQEEFYKNYLTMIAQRTGEFDKTIPLIQQNLKSNSSDEASLKSLFYQSMKKGDFEAALAEFERIAAEKPEDISINTMVAELNVISGNHKTAEVLIEKLLKDLPQNTRAHLLKGRLLFDTQKYEEAYRYFGEYIANFKDDVEPKTYYYLALSCIKTGRPVEAVDNMKIEIEKSSVNTSKLLLREMESMFFKEKMFNTAINFFTELSKKYPGDSELFSKISLFHYYKGDYEKAVEYGQKAMEFKSDSFSAAYILAMAHSRLGDSKKAMELFKLCAQTSPGLSTAAFNASVEQSASLVWPFAHQYLCYIHSALRCGEMTKVTAGLNELFGFLAEKTPPKFVVKDIQSVNPFAVRPE